jgi:hypothetical protein
MYFSYIHFNKNPFCSHFRLSTGFEWQYSVPHLTADNLHTNITVAFLFALYITECQFPNYHSTTTKTESTISFH